MATEHAAKMAGAVAAVAPALREQGFNKQRNAFNREMESGLVQVISFQMGPHMPPGTQFSGLREDYYGTFTINLGLWFSEVAELDKMERPRFVREVDCHLRQRLGFLLAESTDTWWNLLAEEDRLAALVQGLILEHALPFLDRFDSRETLLTAWHSRDPAVSNYAVTRYVIAVLHTRRDEKPAAEEVLKAELRDLGLRHPKARSLLEAAAEMGLDVGAR